MQAINQDASILEYIPNQCKIPKKCVKKAANEQDPWYIQYVPDKRLKTQ